MIESKKEKQIDFEKLNQLEDVYYEQAKIIISELRAARQLACRMKCDPSIVTEPYLSMLNNLYEPKLTH